jgi:hypothetical protein
MIDKIGGYDIIWISIIHKCCMDCMEVTLIEIKRLGIANIIVPPLPLKLLRGTTALVNSAITLKNTKIMIIGDSTNKRKN